MKKQDQNNEEEDNKLKKRNDFTGRAEADEGMDHTKVKRIQSKRREIRKLMAHIEFC